MLFSRRDGFPGSSVIGDVKEKTVAWQNLKAWKLKYKIKKAAAKKTRWIVQRRRKKGLA
jgi:hypothetical protein